MYSRFLLSVLLSTCMLSPSFAMEDDKESEVNFTPKRVSVSQLKFVKERKENPRAQTTYSQDVAFYKSLRTDKEKELKVHLESVTDSLFCKKNTLKNWEEEAHELELKLKKDPTHKHFLKRQAYLKIEREKLQVEICQLQPLLEKTEIEKAYVMIVKEMGQKVFNELIQTRSKIPSIYAQIKVQKEKAENLFHELLQKCPRMPSFDEIGEATIPASFDVWFIISGKLENEKDVVHLSQVCKLLYRITKSNAAWEGVAQKYGVELKNLDSLKLLFLKILEVSKNRKWKETFAHQTPYAAPPPPGDDPDLLYHDHCKWIQKEWKKEQKEREERASRQKKFNKLYRQHYNMEAEKIERDPIFVNAFQSTSFSLTKLNNPEYFIKPEDDESPIRFLTNLINLESLKFSFTSLTTLIKLEDFIKPEDNQLPSLEFIKTDEDNPKPDDSALN